MVARSHRRLQSRSERLRHDQAPRSISEQKGLKPGARVCLASDSSRRGVINSQGSWAVRFVDKSRNIRPTDLNLLQSDAASFEPSLAPLSFKRQRGRTSAHEPTRKRRRVHERDTALECTAAEGTALEGTTLEVAAADSDSDCDECPVCLEVLNAATAVLLDCTHVFCATCHEKLSKRASSRQTRAGAIIECPMCRKRAKLTEIA